MIFKCDCEPRTCLIVYTSKVYTWRVERDRVYGEDAKQGELYWQHLVGSRYFYRNAHSELLVFVFWWVFILLDQEPTARLQNRAVWLELSPDLEPAVALDET